MENLEIPVHKHRTNYLQDLFLTFNVGWHCSYVLNYYLSVVTIKFFPDFSSIFEVLEDFYALTSMIVFVVCLYFSFAVLMQLQLEAPCVRLSVFLPNLFLKPRKSYILSSSGMFSQNLFCERFFCKLSVVLFLRRTWWLDDKFFMSHKW